MSKDKWVRRFSVDETSKHKNGFTIYKITSVLFPIESPEAVTAVSVWKRYSDIQRLHKSMKSLHSGLHLRGSFPSLPRYSFFRRFQHDVITDRAKTIKTLLEFIAEHRLLFTSTDFVNFLQTGYPSPSSEGGVINAIRSSLHLPVEETAPLEYQTDDDDTHNDTTNPPTNQISRDETDFISQIPIYEAADVEIRKSPETSKMTESFDSLNSLESIDSDVFDELSKLTIDKPTQSIKKNVLPDLINFDAPSTSKFDDYHTMRAGNDGDSVSLNTHSLEPQRASSRASLHSKRSVPSLSHVQCATRTEDTYIFEAGYMLNLAARCEDSGHYTRAFDCYKSAIEKLLVGAQSDTDPQRRILVKEKTNKYISYAENIYKNHLANVDEINVTGASPAVCAAELCAYVCVCVLCPRLILALHTDTKTCYVIKVLDKIPNNLTEFDEYFVQHANETKRPILPTSIPYMVQLHTYIETDDVIFLILTYAPGEKLFDYIDKYTKTAPNTPLKQNLENVFVDRTDINNDNLTDSKTDVKPDGNSNDEVQELVVNSKELLMNVDKVLSGLTTELKTDDNFDIEMNRSTEIVTNLPTSPRAALPGSTVCKWAAEILTALHCLHKTGVLCIDLNPSNILLGDKGQAILTYFVHYEGLHISKLRKYNTPYIYIAPEVYLNVCDVPGVAADYWSLGAILYQLICGFPLSLHHRSIFTSHTILYLPEKLTVEEESLLTQLLTYSPTERLGAGPDGILEIKRHPYFKNIDWQQIYDDWTFPD